MKYCSECGTELMEGAALCPKCGFTVNPIINNTRAGKKVANLEIAAKVLLVFSCIAMGVVLVESIIGVITMFGIKDPAMVTDNSDVLQLLEIFNLPNLFWVLRVAFVSMTVLSVGCLVFFVLMTVHYFKVTAKKQNVGLVFKIFALFVNGIAGILMFIADYYKNKQFSQEIK